MPKLPFVTLSPSLIVILRERSDRRISLRVNSAKGLKALEILRCAQNDKVSCYERRGDKQ